MEESILISSDSESRSPPVVLEYDDDLVFPKTKLRDICGSDTGSLKTTTIKAYNAEPIASTSKYIPLASDVVSRDTGDVSSTSWKYGSRPSTSGTTKNRDGAGSYVHGVSDSDTSLTDFLSDSEEEPTANHRGVKPNSKPAGDRGQTNDTVGDKWITLSDEDTDRPPSRSSSTLPPDPVPDVDVLHGLQSGCSKPPPILSASSSATLPPAEPSSFRYTLEKKPSFHDLSDSDGSSNTVEPKTISDIRSRDSWYPHDGDVGLSNARPEPLSSPSALPPFHDDKSSDLLSLQSEAILSNSFSISDFVSQLETDSQPIPASSQSLGSQKRPKSNINDVYERKRLKELKIKEKSERAAAAEKVRRMKPGECMKYVTVVLDQNIITEYTWGKAVIEILTLAGIKHSVEVSTDPCIVKWTREQAEELVPHQEKHVLFLWSTEKLLTSVQFGSLSDTFADFKKKYENFKLYLCVYGLQNYYRKYRCIKKTQNNCADPPRRKRKSNYEITPDNLEMELIALQIKFGISHKTLNSPQDVAFFLQVMTKSVAEMPFKLEKEKIEMERNWYAKGDSKKCVRIDKDFNGLRQLWLQQLSQFNLSSLDIAKSIAELYPTPLSLYKAYQLCGSNERERMLQDIVVKRGPGGGGRRLGPELSRKISLMFCQNEDVSLGCTLEKIGSLLYS